MRRRERRNRVAETLLARLPAGDEPQTAACENLSDLATGMEVRMKRLIVLVVAAAAVGGIARGSLADSTPIGALPAGPVSTVDVQRGELVAVALPRRGAGRVWRIARPLDAKVLRQVSEGDVGTAVVLVFRATGTGNAAIALALTKGDTSSRALESRRFRVHVRPR